MPRAQSETQTTSDTKLKKAPAKRAASRAKKDLPARTTTRSRTTARQRKAPAATATEPTTTRASNNPAATTTSRKAPTPIAATSARTKRSRVVLAVAGGVSAICVGAGVFIGVADSGVIDVNTIITTSNEQISRGEYIDSRTGEPVTRTISTQSGQQRPNSGLRASASAESVAESATEEVVSATSTATTTPAEATATELDSVTNTATTTEEVLED